MALPTFGATIKAWRGFRGLKNHELADKSGIERSLISRLEHGRSDVPRDQNIIKLAGALDVDPRVLLARFSPGGYIEALLMVESHVAAIENAKNTLDPNDHRHVLAQLELCSRGLDAIGLLIRWVNDRDDELRQRSSELADRDWQELISRESSDKSQATA